MRHLLVIGLLTAFLWQLIPPPAEAEEASRPITAWPLLYHRADADHAETDIIWPILRYEREKSWTRYALRPLLFSTESDPTKNYRKTSVIWPVSIYKRSGPELSFHIFPIYWYGISASSRYNVIFPIYWDGEGKDYSYFHLWPLFGLSHRGESFTEYSTAYPFFRYGRDTTSGEMDLHAPWPIVNIHTKADYRSHRVLPFYWYERGLDHSGGFVFPYYWSNTPSHRSRGVLPFWYSTRGPELKTDLVVPFYLNRETPKEHLRFIAPLYFSRKTEVSHLNTLVPVFLNYETSRERLRLITPLYVSRRTEETRLSALIPVYLNYEHEKQDFGLQIGLPFYLRYRSGPFTFSSFFPLYYHSEDTTLRTAFTYYFPLYGSYQRGDAVSRHFILFPLYSTLEDEELQLKAWDVVWPLFHYESSPSMLSVRALPFYWRTRTPEYGLTVGFPLYWSFASGENSYWHFLPLYGVHQKGDWYTKRFILGPLFIDTRDTHAGRSQQDILFPIFSRAHEGEKERSWLIPFYFHRSDPNSRLTLGSLALLPPYYINSQRAEHDLFQVWPLYGRWQRGSYREYSTLWPLIRFGHDTDHDLSMTHLLLYYHKRERKNSFATLFPLWWHRSSPQTTLDSTLFLHWYEHDAKRDATRLSFVWLIPPKLSLIRYEGGPHIVKHSVFPLYSYEQDDETSALNWSFLWPLFSYNSQGEFVRETGFLWQVISYERKDAKTSDFRLLWRFIRSSKTATSSTFEFNPFYYHETEAGKGSYWAILGGLIGREATVDGNGKMRWLWIF